MKVVDSLDDALEHIYQYGTGHSDAIITEDYSAAMRFLDEVDTAVVYVNASTQFTDGAPVRARRRDYRLHPEDDRARPGRPARDHDLQVDRFRQRPDAAWRDCRQVDPVAADRRLASFIVPDERDPFNTVPD